MGLHKSEVNKILIFSGLGRLEYRGFIALGLLLIFHSRDAMVVEDHGE